MKALVAILALLALSCADKSRSEPTPAPTDPVTASVTAKEVAPVQLPGTMAPAPWPEDTARVAAVRTGGQILVVAAGTGWLRWYDAKLAPIGEATGEVGGVQVLEPVDLDGDGSQELVVGRGVARGAENVSASLQVLHFDGAVVERDIVPLPPSSRAQVVGAAPGPEGTLWVAAYVSKYELAVRRMARDAAGAWSEVESRGSHKVSGGLGSLPDGTPILAQMYGDNADEPGGVYLLAADGAQALPSTRGARGVLARGGPKGRVVFADGWHKEYVAKGQGLITTVTLEQGRWQVLSSIQVPGVFGYQRLRWADLSADPGLEVLASGNGRAVVVATDRQTVFHLGDIEALDAYPIDLDGDGQNEVLIAGPKPSIWKVQ